MKSMEEVMRSNCSLLAGREVIPIERVGIVAQALKDIGFIHKDELPKLDEVMLDILDNITYWDTCPNDYRDKIKAFLKRNGVTNDSKQEE